MTVLIVLAMVISLLLIDYVIQLRQARKTVALPVHKPASVPMHNVFLPEGVFATPGQLWSVLLPSGRLRLGINYLLTSLLGPVDHISLPKVGQTLHKGQAFCTVKQNGRSLVLTSPVDGVVTELNQNLLNRPDKLSGEIPSAWMLTVKPQNLSSEVSSWRLGEEARGWFKMEINRLRDFLAPAAQPAFAAMMQDGGLPAPGSLKQLDDKTWQRFQAEFLNHPIEQPGDQKR